MSLAYGSCPSRGREEHAPTARWKTTDQFSTATTGTINKGTFLTSLDNELNHLLTLECARRKLKSSPLAITIATSATPSRHADHFRRIAPRAMRPSSLGNSCDTRHPTRRPLVIITTGIKSIAICQQSSAGTPPTTADGHDPSRASQMREAIDPAQRRLEGRHARAHVAESVAAIER